MSGWHHLHALFCEKAPRWIGTECPNDGTLLQQGSGGELRCPFDGWTGDPGQAMPGRAGDDPYMPGYAGRY